MDLSFMVKWIVAAGFCIFLLAGMVDGGNLLCRPGVRPTNEWKQVICQTYRGRRDLGRAGDLTMDEYCR